MSGNANRGGALNREIPVGSRRLVVAASDDVANDPESSDDRVSRDVPEVDTELTLQVIEVPVTSWFQLYREQALKQICRKRVNIPLAVLLFVVALVTLGGRASDKPAPKASSPAATRTSKVPKAVDRTPAKPAVPKKTKPASRPVAPKPSSSRQVKPPRVVDQSVYGGADQDKDPALVAKPPQNQVAKDPPEDTVPRPQPVPPTTVTVESSPSPPRVVVVKPDFCKDGRDPKTQGRQDSVPSDYVLLPSGWCIPKKQAKPPIQVQAQKSAPDAVVVKPDFCKDGRDPKTQGIQNTVPRGYVGLPSGWCVSKSKPKPAPLPVQGLLVQVCMQVRVRNDTAGGLPLPAIDMCGGRRFNLKSGEKICQVVKPSWAAKTGACQVTGVSSLPTFKQVLRGENSKPSPTPIQGVLVRFCTQALVRNFTGKPYNLPAIDMCGERRFKVKSGDNLCQVVRLPWVAKSEVCQTVPASRLLVFRQALRAK